MVLSEELCVLTSCLLRPVSRNSVLEELGVEDLHNLLLLIILCFQYCELTMLHNLPESVVKCPY